MEIQGLQLPDCVDRDCPFFGWGYAGIDMAERPGTSIEAAFGGDVANSAERPQVERNCVHAEFPLLEQVLLVAFDQMGIDLREIDIGGRQALCLAVVSGGAFR